MIYQQPLAYLLGIEGIALLRAFAGDYGRDFTQARLAEIRALLDSADQFGDAAETHPVTAVEGYRAWAADLTSPGTGSLTLSSLSSGKFWTHYGRTVPRWIRPAAPAATPSTWPPSATR